MRYINKITTILAMRTIAALSVASIAFCTTVIGADAIARLTTTGEQYKYWYESENKPLRSTAGKFVNLRLPGNNVDCSTVTLTAKQNLALHDEIERNIESLCAKNFEDYYKSIKKISERGLKISPAGYRKMRVDLKANDAIRRTDLLTDYELTEAYWMLTSQVGYSNSHFVGIIPSESYYQLKEIRNRDELESSPDPSPKDRKICGALLQASSFLWCGSEPSSEFDNKGKLLIADIRYMFKTDVANLAYPICVRVYWCVNLEKWIPWYCVEYNVTKRYCNMVF